MPCTNPSLPYESRRTSRQWPCQSNCPCHSSITAGYGCERQTHSLALAPRRGSARHKTRRRRVKVRRCRQRHNHRLCGRRICQCRRKPHHHPPAEENPQATQLPKISTVVDRQRGVKGHKIIARINFYYFRGFNQWQFTR